jgi:hypothetical protein
MTASVDRRAVMIVGRPGAMTEATGIMMKALDGLPAATTSIDTQNIGG